MFHLYCFFCNFRIIIKDKEILVRYLIICDLFYKHIVEENMETLENPLHEACKRGNLDFLKVYD